MFDVIHEVHEIYEVLLQIKLRDSITGSQN